MTRCTPRCIRTDERLELDISEDDHAKLSRGHEWSVSVTDRPSGRRFALWDAPCGISGCRCDAHALELPQ